MFSKRIRFFYSTLFLTFLAVGCGTRSFGNNSTPQYATDGEWLLGLEPLVPPPQNPTAEELKKNPPQYAFRLCPFKDGKINSSNCQNPFADAQGKPATLSFLPDTPQVRAKLILDGYVKPISIALGETAIVLVPASCMVWGIQFFWSGFRWPAIVILSGVTLAEAIAGGMWVGQTGKVLLDSTQSQREALNALHGIVSQDNLQNPTPTFNIKKILPGLAQSLGFKVREGI